MPTEFRSAKPRPSRDRPLANAGTVHRKLVAAMALRGMTIRGWAYHWAQSHGRNQQMVYELTRKTIQRRLDKGLPPKGAMGAQIITALRADFGPQVIPHPHHEHTP